MHSQLKDQFFQRWPDAKRGIPESIYQFWNYWDGISVEDGLIFNTPKAMIATSKQQKFLIDLNVSHLGEEKSLLKGQKCVYWPGTTEDIKQYIRNVIFASLQNPTSRRSPLFCMIFLVIHWRYGAYLLHHNSHDYLLTADHFSNFPLVRILSIQMAAHIVSLLKTIFQEDGIPAYVLTDQMRQLTSAEFQEFARYYQFEIFHSTPLLPQSNGFTETMVKIVKQTMNKAGSQAKTHILQCYPTVT